MVELLDPPEGYEYALVRKPKPPDPFVAWMRDVERLYESTLRQPSHHLAPSPEYWRKRYFLRGVAPEQVVLGMVEDELRRLHDERRRLKEIARG